MVISITSRFTMRKLFEVIKSDRVEIKIRYKRKTPLDAKKKDHGAAVLSIESKVFWISILLLLFIAKMLTRNNKCNISC